MDKFKMVPCEPTEAMIYAGNEEFGIAYQYRAMLAAAPAPVFDEAAEREKFEAWHASVWPDGAPMIGRWMAWLACARLKAGQPS